MIRTLLALMAGLWWLSLAQGQISMGLPAAIEGIDRPMRLAPVEIEEVGDRQTAMERPTRAAADDHREPVGDESVKRMRVGAGESLSQMHLGRLHRPIKSITLGGLESNPTVSHPGFTSQMTGWVSSAEVQLESPVAESTTYCRRRLYFEDASLERCGRSNCVGACGFLINLHSGAEFLFDTSMLPFRLFCQPADDQVCGVAE